MSTDPDELRLRALEEKSAFHAEQAAERQLPAEEDRGRRWADARGEKQAADLEAIDAECMEIIARQDKRAGRENTEAQRIIFQRKADALAADANRKRRELGVAEAELSATLASLDRFEQP